MPKYRDSYYEGHDTLRREKLDESETFLRHRPRVGLVNAGATIAATFLSAALVGMCAAVVIRCGTPWVATPLVLSLSVLAGVAVAATAVLNKDPIQNTIRLALAGPLIWSLLVAFSWMSSPVATYLFGFGCLALPLTVLAARHLADYFIAWLLAAPSVPRGVGKKLDGLWRLGIRQIDWSDVQYRVGIPFAIGLAWLLASKDVHSHAVGVCITALAFAIAALWRRTKGGNYYLLWLAMQRQWLSRVADDEGLPGVFSAQSLDRVWGMAKRLGKPRLIWASTSLVAFMLLPTAFYFPMTMTGQMNPWVAAATVDPPGLAPVFSRFHGGYSKPERHTSRTIYERLSTTEAKSLESLGLARHFEQQETLRQQLIEKYYRLDVERERVKVRARLGSPATGQQEWWLAIGLLGTVSGNTSFFIYSNIVALVCSVLVPFLVVSSVVWTFGVWPAVIVLDRLTGELDWTKQNKSDELHAAWDTYIDRIQNSDNPIERDSLLLGFDPIRDVPILLPTTVLNEHAHILGSSGSGKTAKAVAPLMVQLIRQAARDTKGGGSVVIIDLKGDRALLHGARLEAKRAGLPFKWFIHRSGYSSFGFNPLTQAHMLKGIARDEQSDVLMQALSLDYGEDYGRSYFAGINRDTLAAILTADTERHSFAELLPVIEHGRQPLGISSSDWDNSTHLFNTIRLLSRIQPLNVTQHDATVFKHAIDMVDVMKRPQVIYFYLPVIGGTKNARECAKLAIHALLNAAQYLEDTASSKLRQTHLFIDEFQQIISSDLSVFLEQARSKRIGVILSNQTVNDLEKASFGLKATVRENTRLKMYFAANDLALQDEVIKSSGESVDVGLVDGGRDELISETLTPRINRNEVITFSDNPELCILQVHRSEGFAQFGGFPIFARTEHFISKAEFDRRQGMPWPKAAAKTMPLTKATSTTRRRPTSRGHGKTQVPEVAQERKEHMQDVFAAIAQEQKQGKAKP